MEEVTPISARKSDHIRINLEEDVRSGLTTGLEALSLHPPGLTRAEPGGCRPEPDALWPEAGGAAADLIDDRRHRTGCQAQPHPGAGRPADGDRHGGGLAARCHRITGAGCYISGAPVCARYLAAGKPGRGPAELWLWDRSMPAGGGDDRGGCLDPAFQRLARSGAAGREYPFRRPGEEDRSGLQSIARAGDRQGSGLGIFRAGCHACWPRQVWRRSMWPAREALPGRRWRCTAPRTRARGGWQQLLSIGASQPRRRS